MIINGKQIAEEVLEELRKEISDKNLNLRLAAVLVGDDLEFKKFVELKGRVAEGIGISFKMYQFPEGIANDELIKETKKIADENDGALVELPLPKHINTQAVLDQVPAGKDVDVLSSEAQARFYDEVQPHTSAEVEPRQIRQILPPAVKALKIVFDKYNINPAGKVAAVFGQGALVGEPVSHWLERQGTKVFRINSKTENPEELSRQADIIVSGVGKPGLVTGDMVKKDVVVIDFGYGKKDPAPTLSAGRHSEKGQGWSGASGKLLGDVDFNSVSDKASLITPVPGGMGPVLIAAVLKNLIELKVKNEKLQCKI